MGVVFDEVLGEVDPEIAPRVETPVPDAVAPKEPDMDKTHALLRRLAERALRLHAD